MHIDYKCNTNEYLRIIGVYIYYKIYTQTYVTLTTF